MEGILRGDPAAVSRAITILESDPRGEAARRILDAVSSRGGKAAIVGVTGPPGVGKSTLIGRLCDEMASRGRRVSVLAIDASSPFSGGAFLGNRVRMEESLHRHGVFMRSIAA
ncbi:MAG: nucleoside-triphosphatase, partial [Conexivisphaera sp.]